MTELLSTKLYIPRARKNLVSRPRLVERLNTGLAKKLTLLAAPAGFGKTSLLGEWIPQSPRCVTWLSLDDGDNDSTKFWSYFISSLQRIRTDLGEDALALLQSPQTPPITSILTTLINSITAFPDAFSIVLDDFHVIDSQSNHESLTYLLDHLPANMNLVITTRVDPPLPLSRMRARDELTEIRADDLRFKTEEAAAFLSRIMDLTLSAEEIVLLETRTEGWVAGLQIAALSMQGLEDISGFIRSFSGSHRHILGYLGDEVINRQPRGTLEFLIRTSILDRLCGPLCDAVTGGSGGQEILEYLEHTNLFITPLDDEGKWYRYHQLFAEVLRARLLHNPSESISELHRRASEWYEEQNMAFGAIEHSIAAADFHRSVRLIEEVAANMLNTGELVRLCNWIRSLPEETLQGKLELAIYAGWAYALAAQIVDAQVWLERAEAFVSTKTSPIVRGRLVGLAAYLAAERQNLEETLRLAQVGLELLGKADPFFRSLVLRTLAHPLQVTGNINGAIDALQEAVSLSRDASHPLADIPAITSLGLQLFWGGQRMKALDLCHQALKQFVDSHSVPLPLAGILYYLLATLLYEGNELVEAQAALNLGMKLTQPLGLLGVDLTGKQVQAWLLAADGDLEAAMAIVEEGQNTAVQGDLPGFVSYFSAVKADLHLRRGELAAARRWQESASLALESPLDPSLDTEYFALARVYLAFKRLDETKRLLTDLEQALRSAERWGRMITVYLLQARLHLEQGPSVAATQALEHALIIGEPEGFVRAFVDEGEPIRLLLLDCQSLIKKKLRDGAYGETIRLLTYTDKLLAAFSQTAPGMESKSDSMIDPLSERELEILSLIATGRSNREIADILVITVSTVKTHINRLYSKLGAQRRTQAILIAREQGLLSD